MKKQKFMNKYKLLQPICDIEGVTIDALKVDEVYEVTHQEKEVLDDEQNPITVVIAIEINGFESQIMPGSFNDFFEEVKDGETV